MSQIFPKWLNLLPFAAAIGGGSVAVGAILFIWWFFSPEYTDVGYEPVQPIPFSHKLHAGSKETGGLGMDCRYCHSNVEVSALIQTMLEDIGFEVERVTLDEWAEQQAVLDTLVMTR